MWRGARIIEPLVFGPVEGLDGVVERPNGDRASVRLHQLQRIDLTPTAHRLSRERDKHLLETAETHARRLDVTKQINQRHQETGAELAVREASFKVGEEFFGVHRSTGSLAS